MLWPLEMCITSSEGSGSFCSVIKWNLHDCSASSCWGSFFKLRNQEKLLNTSLDFWGQGKDLQRGLLLSGVPGRNGDEKLQPLCSFALCWWKQKAFPERGEAYQLLERPHSTEFFTNSSTVTGLTGAAPEELQRADGKNTKCVKKTWVHTHRYIHYLIPLPVASLPQLWTDPRCWLALLSEDGADGRLRSRWFNPGP